MTEAWRFSRWATIATAIQLLLCVSHAIGGPLQSTECTTVRLVVSDPRATQPAINDNGEIVFVKDGELVSDIRGFLANGVDASNVGLSNSGEVVYANGLENSQVTSSVRGILVSQRSFGPTISPTSEEVAYIEGFGDFNFATTLQGRVEMFDRAVGWRVGVGDVNDAGEVVFELRLLPDDDTRVYSTTRGFLTPVGENAVQPAINNSGETVWSGFDSFGRQQIFSSTRGQLTFFGGLSSFLTADLPDINNGGTVVFRGLLDDGEVGSLFTVEPCLVVSIDIKPGSEPNSVNTKSKGVIPVALLSTNTVDANEIDPSTVTFGPNAARLAHSNAHLEDVDEDGDTDLVLHFRTQETGIQCGAGEAAIFGMTFDGVPFMGADSIRTVGCKVGNRR